MSFWFETPAPEWAAVDTVGWLGHAKWKVMSASRQIRQMLSGREIRFPFTRYITLYLVYLWDSRPVFLFTIHFVSRNFHLQCFASGFLFTFHFHVPKYVFNLRFRVLKYYLQPTSRPEFVLQSISRPGISIYSFISRPEFLFTIHLASRS